MRNKIIVLFEKYGIIIIVKNVTKGSVNLSQIRFFALGGLGENGKNMYVIEVDKQLFILDAGIKYPSAELYGVDISEDAVSICKKHGIDAVFGDARSLPLKNDFFDFVFSFGTVEHFPETKQALLEHIRILKPGGYAWIEVPNAWSLPGLHTYLGNLVHRRDPYRVMVEQGKRYSMRAIKKMAHASPQRIFVRVQGSGDCVPYMRYFMWLDRMMPGVFRRFFGGNVGVIVGKK